MDTDAASLARRVEEVGTELIRLGHDPEAVKQAIGVALEAEGLRATFGKQRRTKEVDTRRPFRKRSDVLEEVSRLALAKQAGEPEKYAGADLAAIRCTVWASREDLRSAFEEAPAETPEPELELAPIMGKSVVAGWKIEEASEDILQQNPGMHPSIARIKAIERDPGLRLDYEMEYRANFRD